MWAGPAPAAPPPRRRLDAQRLLFLPHESSAPGWPVTGGRPVPGALRGGTQHETRQVGAAPG
jgi:hypothetical protein